MVNIVRVFPLLGSASALAVFIVVCLMSLPSNSMLCLGQHNATPRAVPLVAVAFTEVGGETATATDGALLYMLLSTINGDEKAHGDGETLEGVNRNWNATILSDDVIRGRCEVTT